MYKALIREFPAQGEDFDDEMISEPATFNVIPKKGEIIQIFGESFEVFRVVHDVYETREKTLESEIQLWVHCL